jgi:hypothetical protein
MDREITFEERLDTLPDKLQVDPLWKRAYYRRAIYLYDVVWRDFEVLRQISNFYLVTSISRPFSILENLKGDNL